MTDQNQSKDKRRRRPKFHLYVIALLLALGVVFVVAFFIPATSSAKYPFIRADHPIDVGSNGNARWFYFMPDNADRNTPTDLAKTARKYLLPKGFREDTTNRPWFRFIHDDQEIIICNHDEIATVADSLVAIHVIHQRVLPGAQRQNCPVVWVREPGQNAGSTLWFKIQKLVHRW
jgi:hypothetical protein